jgi:nicotinamidase-related amidase
VSLRLKRGVMLARQVREAAWAPCAAALGRVFRRDRVKRVVEGDGPAPASEAVVFCHFHRAGNVAPHTRRYIDALAAEGLPIVFVSNAPNLSDATVAWLRARCGLIVLRGNLGHDFGAWRDGMRVAGLPRPGMRRLILANDSVYGPFAPLDDLLRRLDPDAADVWGLTESWQHRYHLQSYFLAFGSRALDSAAFRDFWSALPDVRSRHWVVQNCEIGLTQRLMRAGLSCRAAWPYYDIIDWVRAQPSRAKESIRPTASPLDIVLENGRARVLGAAANRIAMNPTADMWRPLLELGFPFIKRDLITKNLTGVPDVVWWRELAGRLSETDARLVLDDLRFSLRHTPP